MKWLCRVAGMVSISLFPLSASAQMVEVCNADKTLCSVLPAQQLRNGSVQLVNPAGSTSMAQYQYGKSERIPLPIIDLREPEDQQRERLARERRIADQSLAIDATRDDGWQMNFNGSPGPMNFGGRRSPSDQTRRAQPTGFDQTPPVIFETSGTAYQNVGSGIFVNTTNGSPVYNPPGSNALIDLRTGKVLPQD